MQLKIPTSFKRGLATFAMITTIFTVLFFLVDLEKYRNNLHSEDLRTLEGGAISIKVCGPVQTSSDGDIVTTSDRSAAKADREEIKNQKGGKNTIDQYFKDSSSSNQNEIAMGLIFAIAPWLAFLVFSIIGWFCYFLCCCCDCCCPPSKCCRCQPKLQKGEKGETTSGLYYVWPVIGGSIFCVWVFIVAIIGLSKAGDLETGFKKVHCSIVSLFDDVLNGALKGKPDEWVGIKGLLNRISSFCDDMSNFVGEINVMFGPRAWLTTQPGIINQAISDMRTGAFPNFDISLLSLTNPLWDITAGSGAGAANITQVQSIYFSTILPQALDIMQDLMNQGITQINQAFEQLQIQGEKIKNDITGFQNQLNSGRDSTRSMVDSVDSFITSIDDNLSMADPIFSLITLIFQAYYGVCLGLSILAIIGIVLIIIFKKNGFRICLHITWCFFCLLMLLGFILSSILMPISHVTMELCGVIDNMLSSKDNFVSYPGMMSRSDADKYSVCIKEFGGDGDILKAFNVKEKLDDVNLLKSKIDGTNSVQGLTDVTSLKDKMAIIENQLTELRDYGSVNGILDGAEIIAADQQLKYYTQYSNAQPTYQLQTQCNNYQIQDLWVFHPDNCTGSWLTNIVPINIAVPDVKTVQTHKCFQFQDTSNQENTRYTEPSPACSVTSNYFQKYPKNMVNQIKLWYTDIKAKANSKLNVYQTSTTGLKAAVGDYFTYLNDTIVSFDDFKLSTVNMIDKVTNPYTGILSQITCTFIGRNMFRLFDSLCVAFVPTIYSLSKIIVVMSMGMFVGSFFLFCAGVRFSNREKYEKEFNNTKVGQQPEKQDQQY